MAEMLGFCPVISRSGPEKPLYGTKNRSQSPWNRPIWGAAREFDFRDEFAADSPLQRRVCKLSVPEALAREGSSRRHRRTRTHGQPRRAHAEIYRVAARLRLNVFVASNGSRPIRPPDTPNVRMVLVNDTAWAHSLNPVREFA